MGAGLPSVTRADTEQMNGNWVLDAERSESYRDAVKEIKLQLLKLHKRHKKDQFSAARSGSGGGNKYYQQEQYSKELRAEDTVDVDWSLPGALGTVMEAKTIKIYQSRMCAMLYDKKFKRLFAINPEGNSYSAKGTGIRPRRSRSHFRLLRRPDTRHRHRFEGRRSAGGKDLA